MELWEYNACVRAYNARAKEKVREQIFLAWHIASLTNAGFAGKLKHLNEYLKDAGGGKKAPQISKEEFDRKLQLLKERMGRNGAQDTRHPNDLGYHRT